MTSEKEFAVQQRYYCSHIAAGLKSYENAIASGDNNSVLDYAGDVSNLAEITLGYVDIIVAMNKGQFSADAVIPQHVQLGTCFRDTGDAILNHDRTIAGAKYKANIDRARIALASLFL